MAMATHSTEAPYKSLDRYYRLSHLDRKAQLDLSYVSTEELKDIKNIIPDTDKFYLMSWIQVPLHKDVLANNYSMLSAAVKVSTTGRFDDKSEFHNPLRLEFHINNINMLKKQAKDDPANVWTLPWKSEMIIFLTIFIMLLILSQTMSITMSGAKESRVEVKTKKFKHHLVMNTNIDYNGQGVVQKLDETVRFFDNPLVKVTEDDIMANMEANADFDTKYKKFMDAKKKCLGGRMKLQTNINEIAITRKLANGKPAPNMKTDTCINKRYVKTCMRELRMSGNSYWGTKGIEIYDM